MTMDNPAPRQNEPAAVKFVHPDVIEALTQAMEYFDNRADVKDGDYGIPEPNNEMQLAAMCRGALSIVEGM